MSSLGAEARAISGFVVLLLSCCCTSAICCLLASSVPFWAWGNSLASPARSRRLHPTGMLEGMCAPRIRMANTSIMMRLRSVHTVIVHRTRGGALLTLECTCTQNVSPYRNDFTDLYVFSCHPADDVCCLQLASSRSPAAHSVELLSRCAQSRRATQQCVLGVHPAKSGMLSCSVACVRSS